MSPRCKKHLTLLFWINLNMDGSAWLAGHPNSSCFFQYTSPYPHPAPSHSEQQKSQGGWTEPEKLDKGASILCPGWGVCCLSLCGSFEGSSPLPFTASMGQGAWAPELCSVQHPDGHTEALLLVLPASHLHSRSSPPASSPCRSISLQGLLGQKPPCLPPLRPWV